MQRPWGCCLLGCFLGLFQSDFLNTQGHQTSKGSTHNGLGPYEPLFKKMPYGIVYSSSDTGVFSIRFLFPDNSSLGQVDGQIIRTKFCSEFLFSLGEFEYVQKAFMHVDKCDCVYV